jgi:hypothetical protein
MSVSGLSTVHGLARDDHDGVTLVDVRTSTEGGAPTTTYTYHLEETASAFRVEHDKSKGLFVLTQPDGQVEKFRDKPVKHLLVEPDPVTGEMRPVVKRGAPSVVYLCRADYEA